MTSLRDTLLSSVDSIKAQVTPADQALLVELTTRYAELAARQQAGEDVETSIHVVLAALENIRVGVSSSAAAEVRSVVTGFLASLTAALIA